MVKIASVIGEISFENVEPAVAIIIGNADAHARLLVAIFAVSHAGDHGHIRERAVVIVAK